MTASSKAQTKARAPTKRTRAQAEAPKLKAASRTAMAVNKKKAGTEESKKSPQKRAAKKPSATPSKNAGIAAKKALKEKEKPKKTTEKKGSAKGTPKAKGPQKPQKTSTAVASSSASKKRRGATGEGSEKKRAKTVPKDLALVGTWEIEIPDDQYGPDPYNDEEYHLSVAETPSGYLEAAFYISPIEGIMRFDKKQAKAKDGLWSYKWRGRETGEGEMQFGRGEDYTGSITLKGPKHLEGVQDGAYGMVKYKGKKISSTPQSSMPQWEYFSEEQYERERVARWK